MSEEKNVPKLRFPGFTEPWEQRKFSDLVQIERGGSPRPIDDFITDSPDGLNWVKIGDAPAQGNRITKTAEKIKPEGLPKTKKVHPGDLILSNSMSFGKPYIMGIDGCIHDGWLLIRNTNNVFDLTFLCRLLGTPQMLNQYRSLAAGSTVNNLNKELVGNTVVTIPKIDEQRVLGQYLEQLDRLITLHQRKLGHVKDLKKSMLQKMFPKNGELYPEVRFPGFTAAWEQRKLGEYVSITSGEAPSKFEVGTELYVKVDDLNYNDKYVVDTQNKVAEHSTVKRVTKGSVVFPKRGAAIMTNKVRIMGIDGYMDTNMMALTSEKLDSEFLYNIISKEGLYKIADTSTIPQINNKHVEPYEVTIPSLDEQRKIGAYFKQLDHLITLHQRELDHLQLLKKGMLQQMFV